MEHPPTNTFSISPDPSPSPSPSPSSLLSLFGIFFFWLFPFISVFLFVLITSIYHCISSFKSPTTSRIASTAPPPPPPQASSSDAVEVKDKVSSGGGNSNSDLKWQKESHGIEIGGECPVCLSDFADGSEGVVKQLKECEHSFHAACIDLWLKSHPNCPVCRGPVAVAKKRPPKKIKNGSSSSSSVSRSRNHEHQGMLADASTLV